MDIGTISARYAKALLKFAVEQKEENRVMQDMSVTVETFTSVPELHSTLSNPTLTQQQVLNLLQLAAGAEAVCATTKQMLALVVKRHRAEMMPFIANSFVQQYYAYKNIVNGQITVPTTVADATVKRIEKLIERQSNSNVKMKVVVDPSIEGGFVLTYGTYVYDASVKSQLRRLKKQLLEQFK